MADVSRELVYRARKLAKNIIHGSNDEQYRKMWNYCEEIMKTNPGSTVFLHVVDMGKNKKRFKR